MSLRHLFNSSGLLIVLGLALGMSNHANADDSAIQTYTDQAVPLDSPPSEVFKNAPLPAGSLSLHDVLKAHAPKKQVEAPSIPAATGLMMSQGMSSVFQKYNVPTSPKPAAPTAPVMPAKAPSQAEEQLEIAAAPASSQLETTSTAKAETAETPASLAYQPGRAPKNLEAPASASAAASETPEKPEIAASTDKTGIVYEPGHAPKSLATSAPATGSATAEPAPTPAKADCTDKVQKWEKSCSEAGYPQTFVGKVYGETRTTCADSSLQDVWVKNTCVPPEEAPAAVKPLKTAKIQAKQKHEDTVLRAPSSAPLAAAQELPATPPEQAAAAPAAPDPAPTPKKEEGIKQAEAPATPIPATTNPEELCGEASETLAYEAPEKNLCRAGSSSSVKGNGPWSWTCTNTAGTVSKCRTLSLGGPTEASSDTDSEEPSAPSAAPASPVSAAAQSSEKARFLQMPPKKAAIAQAMPEPAPEPEVPLVCGSANNQPARTAPATGLCESGTASAVKGKGPYTWTCGSGRKKISCSTIKPIDGVCGKANGNASASEPTSGLCKKGIPGAVSSEETSWTWTCGGSNGGIDAVCSTTKAAPKSKVSGKSSEIPELKKAPASDAFGDRPEPTPIPESIEITADAAPEAAPKLPEEATPIPPPPLAEIPATPATPTPALQNAHTAAPVPAAERQGAKLVLDPTLSAVLFTHLSETIDPRSSTTLNKLADLLKKNTSRISLTAYADGAGLSPHAVHRLSLARALAVRSYLASKGIPENRIDIHAEGASAPTGYPDRVDIKVKD